MTISMEEIQQLHSMGLYTNLKTLLSFVLKLPEFLEPIEPDFGLCLRKYELLVYYGDALYEESQFFKAEVAYQQALNIYKAMPKLKNKDVTMQTGHITNEVTLRFKIHQCLMKRKEYTTAMTILEMISPKQRTCGISMRLGQLYQRFGKERSAVTCYKDVLRSSPVAIEAALALLKLGVTVQEICSLLSASDRSPPEWFLQYLKAESFSMAHKHQKALQIYTTLDLQSFRESASLLSAIGECHYMLGNNWNSMLYFKRARVRDKYLLDKMDVYAHVLYDEQDTSKLERLALDLNRIDENGREALIAMSYYCASIHQERKAVYFAQKVHVQDSTDVAAIILKAKLFQILEKHTEAINHYKESMRLAPNMYEPYEGLAECYTSLEKPREALTVARNAHKTIGANARTLTLCGQAYYQLNQTQEKGRTLLQKALSIEPRYLPAVYLLCGILVREEKYDEAVPILTKQLEWKQTSKLYQLLGDCYKGLGDHQKGLEQYSKSLRIDPDNVKALSGIEAVEGSSTSEVELSTISMQEQPRHRSSMEDLDNLATDSLLM